MTELQELLWDAYWQGYAQGYGVEELSDLDERAARGQFEQWRDCNVGEASVGRHDVVLDGDESVDDVLLKTATGSGHCD